MSYSCVTTLNRIKEYLAGAALVAFDFETSPLDKYRSEERAALDAHKSNITGVSFSVSEGSGIYVPLRHRIGKNATRPEAVMGYLQKALFENTAIVKVAHNGMFKALTGEDFITAERKNKDPFSFRPYARLLFSCNEIPRNYGDRSDGFYRRLLIVRFDHSVPKEKRDPNLREKLFVERNGILMWAVEGLKRLIADGYEFTETDATRAELQRYKVESNSALLFVDECCVLDAEAEYPREDLFQSYRDYCNKNGLKPMSQANFNKDVESVSASITRKTDRLGKRRVWRGLRYQD